MKKVLSILLGLLMVAAPMTAQAPPAPPNRSSFVGGVYYASNYAYGITSAPVKILSGPTATGAGTIYLASGSVSLPDGRVIAPFATTAAITVGTGATLETVTPSAVSNCYAGSNSCAVTATFTYLHGQGDIVRSGTIGLQEAINDAKNNFAGGQVVVDGYWKMLGGTSTMITSTAIAQTGVGVTDFRSTGPVYYGKTSSSYVAVLTLGAASVTAVGLASTSGTFTTPVIAGGLTASGIRV
jgi:hypothetical protein